MPKQESTWSFAAAVAGRGYRVPWGQPCVSVAWLRCEVVRSRFAQNRAYCRLPDDSYRRYPAYGIVVLASATRSYPVTTIQLAGTTRVSRRNYSPAANSNVRIEIAESSRLKH